MVPAADQSPHVESPVGARTFRCAECDFPITLRLEESPPECPRCGSERFAPGSIFSVDTAALPAPSLEDAPAWLTGMREALAGSGPHLAWEGGGDVETTFIRNGLTRIGRSFLAEVHLLDPTVSRRHALIHRSGRTCVVLDDHSLNGVFVRGERVDWRPLADGDEIEIGRFRLHFIEGAWDSA